MNRLILKLRIVQLQEDTLAGIFRTFHSYQIQYFSFSTKLTETNGALIGVSRNSLQGKSYFSSTSQLFSLSADC